MLTSSYCWATHIQLVFSRDINHCPLSHRHYDNSVPFVVPVYNNDASIHHLVISRLLAVMYLFVCNILFRYMRPCLSFPQLSLSGSFTLVVKNDTIVYTHGALVHRNRSCVTIKWNWLACTTGSGFLPSSSLILKRLSLAREAFVPLRGSGNFWCDLRILYHWHNHGT